MVSHRKRRGPAGWHPDRPERFLLTVGACSWRDREGSSLSLPVWSWAVEVLSPAFVLRPGLWDVRDLQLAATLLPWMLTWAARSEPEVALEDS